MFSALQNKPSSALMELIRRREWQPAACRIMSHPWDVQYKTSNRATALHHACLYRAPRYVVLALLQVDPLGIMAQDSEGWTPLHVALLYATEEDVILLLIERGGANVTSAKYISSPLHLACRHGVSTRILQALLEACPELASSTNESGTRPANLLWFDFRRRTRQHDINDLPVDNENLQDMLQRLSLLIHAAQGRSLNETRNTISLHEVIQLHSELEHLIGILIQLDPTECRRRDDDGNLPLHHLVKSTGCQFVLDKLLETYPTAASMKDSMGRLPLHVALQNGWTWKTGIHALVQASPESLEQPNEHTKLYPAQEAVHDVDTVLELLLRWPVLLQHQ